MKKQTKLSKLKLNKLSISHLNATHRIHGGGDGKSAPDNCTEISIIICGLPTENDNADTLSD